MDSEVGLMDACATRVLFLCIMLIGLGVGGWFLSVAGPIRAWTVEEWAFGLGCALGTGGSGIVLLAPRDSALWNLLYGRRWRN